MDNEEVENDVVSIELIDPFGVDDVVPITSTRGEDRSTPIPDDASLKTGNIIAQVFNLIAQVRDRDYWQLNDSEVSSLNKTCPKVLPNIITERSGFITCVLSIVGIFVKRLKLERDEAPEVETGNGKKFFDNLSDKELEVIESERENKPLTGARND